MASEWKKHIIRDNNDKQIYLITKDEKLYKGENGEHVFYKDYKSCYEFLISHEGCSFVVMYLSPYRT